MNNHNKWGALSMQDRAFLIRESVKNGVTNLDEIRNTWEHRFDGTKDNIPTEDEYIAQRAAEKRAEALNKARTVNSIPELFVEKGWAQKESDEEEYNLALSNLNSLEAEYRNLMIKKLSPNVKGPLSVRDHIHINWLKDEIPKAAAHLEYCKTRKDNPKAPGTTCINTVSGYYGRNETWNERFARITHGELGFKKISDKEIEPGDIVQFGEAVHDPTTGEWKVQNPRHALMSNTNYDADSTNMRWNGSDGGTGEKAKRINSIYPMDWESAQAYRFVGNKADSLQWKKDYREEYGHLFSGEDNNKIQTDSEHKTDNSLIERIALNIGSRDSAKDEGRAGVRDIIMGTINALVGKQPTSNTNLAAFLGKPEDYGFEEINDNRGPQFHERISQYADQDMKTYKGIINPFNEYVVSQEDYDKFLELAKTGEIFYGNADGENVHSLYGMQNGRHYTIGSSPLHSGYRDDVQNYPIQFYTKEGKLYANAADFYDFNTDSWQGKMLTKKGKPYILRQNDIPVRSIYVPEDLLNLNTLYNVEEGLTDDVRRARNMHITVKNREKNK